MLRSDMTSPQAAVLGLLIATVGYLALQSYRVTTNPLSRLPGPTVSKWTNLRLKYAVLTGERVRYVHGLHQQYGPLVRISPDEVAIADIKAAKTIYKMGSPFRKTSWYAAFTGQTKVLNLFTMIDQHEHGALRRLTANNFTEKWIKNLEPYIARNVRLAIDRMVGDVQTQGYVDIFKWFLFMATDVIGEAAFGESFRMLETGKKNQYIKDLDLIASTGIMRAEFPWLPTVMGYIPFGSGKEIKQVVTRFIAYAEESIERYWTQLKADPENVKPTLLTKEYAGVEDGTLTFPQLRRDAVGFIVAGTDTTAITAMYAVWRLTQVPEAQRWLIEEVSTLPEGFDDEDLKPLECLDHVIKETLRLNGAVQQALLRAVPEDGVDFCGYYIPAGKVVGVQSYTTHRDPTIWNDPERFDPSRWKNVTKEMRDSYYPFGGGSGVSVSSVQQSIVSFANSHIVCIGMHFAQLELRYALAHFYRSFPAGMKPAFVEGFTEDDMVQLSWFLEAPKGKRCFVAPRK